MALIIVLTKADKLRQERAETDSHQDACRQRAAGGSAGSFVFSETHEGRDALWGEIRAQFNGLQKHESGTRELPIARLYHIAKKTLLQMLKPTVRAAASEGPKRTLGGTLRV